jgi:tetratricopeptide (TPR) repeat protein
MAELHHEQGRLQEAAAAYREAIAAGLLEAREDYADLLAYELDLPEQAIEQYELALAEDVVDKATLWWEIGQARERAGDLGAAAAAYREMLAEGDIDAHHALGTLALETGDLVAAEQHFRNGLAAGDPDALDPLCNLLVTTGRADEADRLAQR